MAQWRCPGDLYPNITYTVNTMLIGGQLAASQLFRHHPSVDRVLSGTCKRLQKCCCLHLQYSLPVVEPTASTRTLGLSFKSVNMKSFAALALLALCAGAGDLASRGLSLEQSCFRAESAELSHLWAFYSLSVRYRTLAASPVGVLLYVQPSPASHRPQHTQRNAACVWHTVCF